MTPLSSPSPSAPLFLSIDSGLKKFRAAILNEWLDIIWTEEVEYDAELPEFGTTNGVYTLATRITAPSLIRITALDLVLEKLARNCPDPGILSRIVAISGAAQQHSTHYLTPSSSTLLSALPSSPNLPLSSLLSPLFSLPTPSSPQDSSTASQYHSLESAFGENGSFVERTGSRAVRRSMAAQVMKLREEGDLGETGRICAESSLLASMFLGRIAPIDVTEAGGTGLFDLRNGEWDREVLGVVMGDREGGERLKEMLGEVELDGAKELGKISQYFVRRYGFDPDCLIFPFSGDTASSFLSYNLRPRDVLVCLGSGDLDTVVLPSPHYIPDRAWHMVLNPARASGDSDDGNQYLAVISTTDAGLGRSLARDMYCNGSWDVFSRLTQIVPHGGTPGLDDKLFSFFFPLGEAGNARGFVRLAAGARVSEFADRKVNPRLLLESQFLSTRIRLARLYSGLAALATPPPPPSSLPHASTHIGFDPYSPSLLPARIILVGGASENPAMVSLLSTILACPVFVPCEPEDTTTVVRGAGYKAWWSFARAREGEERSFGEFVAEVRARRPSQGPTTLPSHGSTSLLESSNPPSSPSIGVDTPSPKTSIASDVVGSVTGKAPPSLDAEEGGWEILKLVAVPDPDEFLYYGSMIGEFLRLEGHVLRGLL